MRRCYLGTALVLGGLLLTGVTPTGSCGIGTLTVYAAEDTFSGELVEAIQNEVVTEDNVETEIPTEETAEQVVVEETPEALTGNSFSLEDQEYQVLLKIVEAEAGCEGHRGPYAGCKCSDEPCEKWVFSKHGHGSRLSETGWNSAVFTRIRRSDRYSECISGDH